MQIVAQGGTITLPVIYKDGFGVLVDPVSPLVDIVNPSEVEVVTNATPVRDSLGQYHYVFAVPALAPLGVWVARFQGVIGGSLVSGDEPFEVVLPGSVGAVAGGLITLAEYKTYKNIDPTDNRQDDQIEASILYASSAVRNYAERDFGTEVFTEDRTYPVDESGYVDIDDAAQINSVSLIISGSPDYTFTSDTWVPLPYRRDDSEVYYYVAIPGLGANFGVGSPEMGFERNLDVLWSEGRLRGVPAVLKVNADWGWVTVPDDVKLAVLWTIEDWLTKSSSGDLTSEAIEGYARSWGGARLGTTAMAVPSKARDLLTRYQKVTI